MLKLRGPASLVVRGRVATSKSAQASLRIPSLTVLANNLQAQHHIHSSVTEHAQSSPKFRFVKGLYLDLGLKQCLLG